MKKILIIFGTRPEVIKLAPLVSELKKSKKYKIKICSTGQHDQMLNQAIDIFKLKIDFSFNLMKKNQKLASIFSLLIYNINKVVEKEKPDLTIVQGDTITGLAGSIVSFFNKIKIAHVEAGLRTFDLEAPWPEEANRKLISNITNYHFAPTKKAKMNLIKEGVDKKKIFVTGNTVVDALLDINKKLKLNKKILKKVSEKLSFLKKNKKIILITLHRREIFGKKIENILQAFKSLSNKFKKAQFVYPVHLNPNIRKIVKQKLKKCPNFTLLPPIDYFELIYLMKKSYLIMSDSGGIQEEAPSFKVPILILRDITERSEIIDTNQAILAGTNKKKIIRIFTSLMFNQKKYLGLKKNTNPFGNGKASKKIVKLLDKNFYI